MRQWFRNAGDPELRQQELVNILKDTAIAAFALFLAFLGVAALYVLAGADFLGVTQIMIYVGGILVLLIFGIMLTQKSDKSADPSKPNPTLGTDKN